MTTDELIAYLEEEGLPKVYGSKEEDQAGAGGTSQGEEREEVQDLE
jgi:hypothetical protein